MVVHRLLAAAIGLERLPDQARDRDALRALCDNLNARHRNAQMAGRASVELHTLIFFRDRQVVADARITKARSLHSVRSAILCRDSRLQPVTIHMVLSLHSAMMQPSNLCRRACAARLHVTR